MGRRELIVCLLLLLSGASFGHSRFMEKKFVQQVLRLDSIMTAHYRNPNIDTAYVMRPQTRWTVAGRFNLAGAKFKVEGIDEGNHFNSELRADFKSTLALYLKYLGFSVSLSLNPAKLAGKYRDYELGFVYYGRQYGFDLIYQDSKNYTGYHKQESYPRIELPADLFKMKTFNISGYYVFNHKKFSYPAAMTQGYIQKRSAGSFMLALSGQGQHGKLKGDYGIDLRITNIGIGGGYGFNYVPARRWLLHISALPTFIVYSHTSLTFNDSKIPLRYHFPEVIITGRGAIVYQVTKNQYMALSGVYYFTDIGSKKRLRIENEKWRARLTYGFRF
ncbi:MAG: DUF4421 family protein [Bacteroidaceae bacterium]|nr:DUF4421 family protein [Bacteroidaceae bacterium]